MVIKRKIFSALITLFISFSCLAQTINKEKQYRVMIETNFGTIKIRLYNETPLHRDNFIKLVKQHYYDSLLFHRVIQNFMIQGGDPDSKYAALDKTLGDGDLPYTIPAEFNSKYFHKKGVLAAGRNGDLENQTQASSATQFYIVQGKIFNDSTLTKQAKRITKNKLFNKIINQKENKNLVEQYKIFVQKKQEDSIKVIVDIINKKVQTELINTKPHTFTEDQIKTYKTIGGTPHLDETYTIFGEVYEGLEVIDKIAAQKTNAEDRPIENIRMKISLIP